MWFPASSERGSVRQLRGPRQRDVARASGACALVLALMGVTLVLDPLCGCSSTRARVAPAAQAPAAQPPAGSAAPAFHPAAALSGATPAAAGTPAGAPPADSSGAAAPRPEVPAAARADFDRAVEFMRTGNDTEAELGFKQVALQYPQFAAPLVNVAILQRKSGELDKAEGTLKSAVERESGSAVAWTELGATQRMRGEFKEAAASYEQAIAADAHYAPAWRNLGVLEDLYLGDPDRALKAFEQYKQLTGEEKPVSGWIAELRQRMGIPAAKRPADAGAQSPGTETPAAPAEAAPQPGGASPGEATPLATPPQGTPQEGAPKQGAPPQAAPQESASATGG